MRRQLISASLVPLVAVLFAALDILDGTVVARCAPRKRRTEFIALLDAIDRAVPT